MSDCYYDADGCLICPEQQAQTYIPSRFEQRAVLGWNAGANSVDTLDRGLRAYFTQPTGVVGIVIGLKGSRKQQTVPSQIEHGWYFQNTGGIDIAQPIERGQVVGAPHTGRSAETLFEIRRINGTVTYLVDDAKVWTSINRSVGPKVVNCCMFASGDTAPSGVGGGSVPPADGDGGVPPTDSDTGAIDHGFLVSGTPLAVATTGNNPDFTRDDFWKIVVGEGATSLTINLADNGGGDFAAEIGWVVVNLGQPLSSNDDGASLTLETSPFNGTITSPDAGTYYIALDAEIAISGMTLTATVT